MEKIKEAIIIGDGHGNFNSISQAVSWGWTRNNEPVPIFLGDLSDSFHKSKNDQLRLMHFVYMCLNEGGWMLWGNHDMSYWYPAEHYASGYTRTQANAFKDIYTKIKNHPRCVPYLHIPREKKEDILITHAGLSPRLVPVMKDPIDFLQEHFDDKNMYEIMRHSPLLKAGKMSGGKERVGGITWRRDGECDERLHSDIIEITGHTPTNTCDFNEKAQRWNIDCHEYGDKSILRLRGEDLFVVTYDQYGTVDKDYV
jgi:hypothetical protein